MVLSQAHKRAHAQTRLLRYERSQKAMFCAAFTELAMIENASLVVWTRGQMRGVRAAIRRLGVFK
jgi:hypothetical protein